MQLAGIFDSDPKRSPFAGAHMVFMPYCSSDAWIGNTGNHSTPLNFFFRGQVILEAAIKQFQEGITVDTVLTLPTWLPNHTHATQTTTGFFQLTANDRVLFGGCSAGARGALFTLDYVQAMLPPGSPQVLGFLDSPLWVDMVPIDPKITTPLEAQTQLIFGVVNATARLGTECARVYPGDEGWRCLYAQYRLPYITTPYLMSASQFDKFALPWNEGGAERERERRDANAYRVFERRRARRV